jgi:hypothetical protein
VALNGYQKALFPLVGVFVPVLKEIPLGTVLAVPMVPGVAKLAAA